MLQGNSDSIIFLEILTLLTLKWLSCWRQRSRCAYLQKLFCELCLLSNNLCINAHLAIYYVDHCQVIAEGVICELAHFFLHVKVISEGNYAKYLKNLRNTFMYLILWNVNDLSLSKVLAILPNIYSHKTYIEIFGSRVSCLK